MTWIRGLCSLVSASVGAMLFVLVLATVSPASVPTVDPHALFEGRCLRCHGHAGAFAREQLRLDGDEVVGKRLRKDIGRFLLRHQGRLTATEATALYDAFRRQLLAGGLFKTRCGACHRQARELTRLELIVADRHLIGRYSCRDMAVFLKRHGSRTEEEAALLYDMLLWHRRTIETAQNDD